MTRVFLNHCSLRVVFISDRNVAPETHSGGKEAMIDVICGGGTGANGSDSDAASIIMAAITAVSVGPLRHTIDLFD